MFKQHEPKRWCTESPEMVVHEAFECLKWPLALRLCLGHTQRLLWCGCSQRAAPAAVASPQHSNREKVNICPWRVSWGEVCSVYV